MPRSWVPIAASAGVFVALGFIAYRFVPQQSVATPSAGSPRPTMTLYGTVRDFRGSHPDFGEIADSGLGHIVGLVSSTLDENGKPVYTGAGARVSGDWRDAQGNSIMPGGPGGSGSGDSIDDFDINDSRVEPDLDFAARFRVLGAAIQNGSYHLPVTAQVTIGDRQIQPFGQFHNAVHGNVNDNQEVTGWSNPGGNPREHVVEEVFEAGTRITVQGRSWTRGTGDSWNVERDYDSDDDTPQIKVLRGGDPVPSIEGAYDQGSVESFIGAYVDYETSTMNLESNQVIYLFELGTDASSSSADFQDLVVLVDLATDPGYFDNPAPEPLPEPPACITVSDSAGSLGAEVDGSVASGSSFWQWFRNSPQINAFDALPITLVRGEDGVYEYDAADFTPIDRDLFGNENDLHNRLFTYEISGEFLFEECSGQMFEFRGDDDAWLFIDGTLVMDLGGVGSGAGQYVEIDRLGLESGRVYPIAFFYAHRGSSEAEFLLRTNINILTSGRRVPSPALYD